jgi:hypothetical protein
MLARSLRIAVLLLSSTTALMAQTPTGRIVGRIIDATTGQGITDAGVQVVGMTLGAHSGVDGRYTITNIPAGTVTIQVRRIGFGPKEVTGLLLAAGQTLEQNVSLAPAAARVAAVSVTASVEKGTVNEALDQQRTAVGVVNAITAEQISKSPDGDASQAIQRVSGVTVQDDKSVGVRGLADRYTVSMLNGSRVPSPEPEKRIVPLDLFPSGLIQSITTSKTFTPDQQGDFAGALVDIRTREFPAQRSVSLQFVGGYSDGSTSARTISARGVGGESFAMAGGSRNLPDLVKSVGNMSSVSLNNADQNLLIGQFRTRGRQRSRPRRPNSAASLSVGGNDPVFGHHIGYLVSGSYSYTTDLKDNQLRALADRGNQPGETRPIDQFTGQTANQSILWGGLANLSTMLGETSRLSFNGMYNRTADNDARVERGHFENEGFDAKITRCSMWSARCARCNSPASTKRVRTRWIGRDVERRELARARSLRVRAGRQPAVAGRSRGASSGSHTSTRARCAPSRRSMRAARKCVETITSLSRQSAAITRSSSAADAADHA